MWGLGACGRYSLALYGAAGGLRGTRCARGGVAASGGESFPGSRSAPDLFVFSHLDFFV